LQVTSVDGVLDTGGGFLAGHFLGKGIKRRNETAQVTFEMNDVAVHSVPFSDVRGMYNEYWALPPSQSFYSFAADDTSAESITGPFTFTVRAELGAALDIRSLRARFEFAPAIFTGPISTPVLDGPSVRRLSTARPSFTWTDITNAEDFQLLVQNSWTGAIVAKGDGLRQPHFSLDEPLSPGGYWVLVRGRNSSGAGPWSRNYFVVSPAAAEPSPTDPSSSDPSVDRAAPPPVAAELLGAEFLWPVQISVHGPETASEGAKVVYVAQIDAPARQLQPTASWRVSRDGQIMASGIGAEIPVDFVDDGDWLIEVEAVTSSQVLASSSLAIRAYNVAPAVSVRGPSTATEGSIVEFRAAVDDPGRLDSSVVTWRMLRDGRVVETGVGESFKPRPGDNGVFVIEAVATDDDGGVSAPAFSTLSVTNVAPTVTGSAPARGVRGQTLLINALAVDPSAADMSDVVFEVAFGDGSTWQTRAAGAAQFEHIYTADGNFTFSIIAVDKDGGRSAAATGMLQVGLVDVDGAVLRVGGGAGKDDIKLQPADANGAISVWLNGVERIVPKGIQTVEVYGQAGDDKVVATTRKFGATTVPFSPIVVVIAGAGNDSIDLRGGAGRNIVSGGSGNDLIYGGTNADLLIGGVGVDRVFGGLGDDYLFGDEFSGESRVERLTAAMD
ncbi:MAG TPA: PKD domain-containing protein, partial [Pirellulaceae bacterium]|nr:PKD domain-containing protein [Pirellulaceae bacterium]